MEGNVMIKLAKNYIEWEAKDCVSIEDVVLAYEQNRLASYDLSYARETTKDANGVSMKDVRFALFLRGTTGMHLFCDAFQVTSDGRIYGGCPAPVSLKEIDPVDEDEVEKFIKGL